MTTSTAVCPGCHRSGDVRHDCRRVTSLTDQSGVHRDSPCKCEVDPTCANWRTVDNTALPDLAAMFGTGAST